MGEVSIIKFRDRDYFHIGSNIIGFVASTIVKKVKASCYAIVTDSNVSKIYLEELMQHLRGAVCADEAHHAKLISYVIPAGETSKTREMKNLIEDWAIENKCDRSVCFIALGGGVVGDLTGYVASTYMRGVPVVQIGTTLLAMIDSSIGGKTGVNTKHGKNLIGSFHQPELVFADLDYLNTLSESEIVAAFGEIIKVAAVLDEKSFQLLERNSARILSCALKFSNAEEIDKQLVMDIIFNVARIKIITVDEDERDSSGRRALLNFGHTIGHAIEKWSEYSLKHGLCVSMGCIYESEISRDLGHLSDVALGRLIACFRSLGLPCYLTDLNVWKETPKCWTKEVANSSIEIVENIKMDKKSTAEKCKMIILSDIG